MTIFAQLDKGKTMREKLLELIGRVQDEGRDYSDVVCSYPTSNGRLADYLIANGVTIPVWCKDCVFCHYNSSNETYKCSTMNGMYRTVQPNEFCSYGERKDNG